MDLPSRDPSCAIQRSKNIEGLKQRQLSSNEPTNVKESQHGKLNSLAYQQVASACRLWAFGLRAAATICDVNSGFAAAQSASCVLR